MAEDKNDDSGILELNYVLRVLFIVGFGCGILLMPFAAYRYIANSEIVNFLLAVIFTPLVNGLVVLLYGLIGYPLYLYLARRKKLGLFPARMRKS